jgi:hypothetical protein
MSIKVNPDILENNVAGAFLLAVQLRSNLQDITSIYNSLDYKVRARQGIDSSMRSLMQRIENAENKMYNISSFLKRTAGAYRNAEATVVANSEKLMQLVGGKIVAGNSTARAAEKPWWENAIKIAVGVVVIAAAVAVAVTVGGPILVGLAVGAVVGAAVGGIIAGVSSANSGGKFMDGFADGFMWGAIGGAATGAVSGAGLGIAATAALSGGVDSGLYVGQTVENGGKITVEGVATSFVVGAGMSAIGTVISNKISSVITNKASAEAEKILDKSATKGVSNANLDQETIDKILSTPKGQRPDPSTYLSQEYIDKHLSQFQDGGAYVMTRDQYDMFVDGKLNIGREDNTLFITSKDYLDDMGTKANGDLSVFEEKLGFEEGHFQVGGGLVRIDIKNPSNFNARIP